MPTFIWCGRVSRREIDKCASLALLARGHAYTHLALHLRPSPHFAKTLIHSCAYTTLHHTLFMMTTAAGMSYAGVWQLRTQLLVPRKEAQNSLQARASESIANQKIVTNDEIDATSRSHQRRSSQRRRGPRVVSSPRGSRKKFTDRRATHDHTAHNAEPLEELRAHGAFSAGRPCSQPQRRSCLPCASTWHANHRRAISRGYYQ